MNATYPQQMANRIHCHAMTYIPFAIFQFYSSDYKERIFRRFEHYVVDYMNCSLLKDVTKISQAVINTDVIAIKKIADNDKKAYAANHQFR